MKFYYKDKLIRTSKTRHYKYAVLYDGKCRACSETRENAEKAYAREYNYLYSIGENNIAYANRRTLEELNRYMDNPYNSKQEYIDEQKQYMQDLRNHMQLVELQER